MNPDLQEQLDTTNQNIEDLSSSFDDAINELQSALDDSQTILDDLQQNEGQLMFPLTQDTIDLLNENSTDFLQLPTTVTLLQSLLPAPAGTNARSWGTGVTTIPDSSVTKLTLANNDFANGITWDSGNSRLTIITAGQYVVTASIAYSGGGGAVAGKLFQLLLRKNNTQVASHQVQGAVDNQALSVNLSDIFDCGVGDYFEIYAYQTSGVNKTIADTSGTCYLSIAKV